MLKSNFLFGFFMLASGVQAGKYRLCVCETENAPDDRATQAVVKATDGRLVYCKPLKPFVPRSVIFLSRTSWNRLV
ncbi:hypothetical protein FMEXI_7131 [Fusarium mexicanum]|uniref:Uncharacterized protein n=1 Tax=Fusarium mexicanum TaxID=751941 RepID=A0A8H5MUZ9_9HYPO|nr:hypothetical protein FMEXI_7131 [Fusarium mexicanum]